MPAPSTARTATNSAGGRRSSACCRCVWRVPRAVATDPDIGTFNRPAAPHANPLAAPWRRPTGRIVDATTPTQSPPETPDRDGAFPRLGDGQIEALSRDGERRRTEAGEVLFRQGDRDYDFFVVLAGKVAIRDGDGPAARLVAVHGAGRFLGELSLLTGQAAFFTAEVIEPGEVLAVPVERLRERALLDPALGDLILRAYLLRREFLIGLGAGLKIVGSRFSPDARRLREFTARNRLPHRWIDVEEDPEAEALLHRLGVAPDETPVVIWAGQVMRNPSSAELARAIGLKLPRAPVTAVRPRRRRRRSGRDRRGRVRRIGGSRDGRARRRRRRRPGRHHLADRELPRLPLRDLRPRAGRARRRSRRRSSAPRSTCRARRRASSSATASTWSRYDDARRVSTRALVIATGARYRKLDVPRLEDFEGAGVYYAATQMEAMLCRGDPVVVVGGGNSAGQATLFMSRQAPMVRLVDPPRRPGPRHVALPRRPDRAHSQRRGPGLHRGSRARRRQRARGAGRRRTCAPASDAGSRRARCSCSSAPTRTRAGSADRSSSTRQGSSSPARAPCRAASTVFEPSMLETSLPGVFAAGDVRSGSVKRVASAVGEGAMAVQLVHAHLQGRRPLAGA